MGIRSIINPLQSGSRQSSFDKKMWGCSGSDPVETLVRQGAGEMKRYSDFSKKAEVGRKFFKKIKNADKNSNAGAVAQVCLEFEGDNGVSGAAMLAAMRTLSSGMTGPLPAVLAKAGMEATDLAKGLDCKKVKAAKPFIKKIANVADNKALKQMVETAVGISDSGAARAAFRAVFNAAAAGVSGPVNTALAKTCLAALSDGKLKPEQKSRISTAFLKKISANSGDMNLKTLAEGSGKSYEESVRVNSQVKILNEVKQGRDGFDRADLIRMGLETAGVWPSFDKKAEALKPYMKALGDNYDSKVMKGLFNDIAETVDKVAAADAMERVLNTLNEGVIGENPTDAGLARCGLEALESGLSDDNTAMAAAAPFIDAMKANTQNADFKALVECVENVKDAESRRKAGIVVLQEVAAPSGLKGTALYSDVGRRILRGKWYRADMTAHALRPLVNRIADVESDPDRKILAQNVSRVNKPLPLKVASVKMFPIISKGFGLDPAREMLDAGLGLVDSKTSFTMDRILASLPFFKTFASFANVSWIDSFVKELGNLDKSSDAYVQAVKAAEFTMKHGPNNVGTAHIAKMGCRGMMSDLTYTKDRTACGFAFLKTIAAVTTNRNEKIMSSVFKTPGVDKASKAGLQGVLGVIGDGVDPSLDATLYLAEAGKRGMENVGKFFVDRLAVGEFFLKEIVKNAGNPVFKERAARALEEKTNDGKLKAYKNALESMAISNRTRHIKEIQDMAGMNNKGEASVVSGKDEVIIDGVKLNINKAYALFHLRR